METLTSNLAGNVRRELSRGREYIVAPVTLIVPGVLNGSQGPLYYPADEVEKSAGIWNGVPITLDHPRIDGKPVSATEDGVVNLGSIKNSMFANGRLKAEAWLDVKLVNRSPFPDLLPMVQRGELIEVSTGLFTKNEELENEEECDGKKYKKIARNYRADHLAILLHQPGACSIADGCGLNQNHAQGKHKQEDHGNWADGVKNEVESKILTALKDGPLDLSEVAYKTGIKAGRGRDPMKSKLNQALVALRDSGKIKVKMKTWGDPVFTLVKNKLTLHHPGHARQKDHGNWARGITTKEEDKPGESKVEAVKIETYYEGWKPEWREKPSPEDFVEARDKSERSVYLSHQTPEELRDCELILSKDGRVGAAVMPDGDLINVFNNGGPKGAGTEAVLEGIDRGAKTLDCFDKFLPKYYHQMGFREVGRMDFNREYAPEGWDFNKLGEPDVVFMALTQKRDRDATRQKVREGKWKKTPYTSQSSNRYGPEDWDKAKDDSRRIGNLRTRTSNRRSRKSYGVVRTLPRSGQSNWRTVIAINRKDDIFTLVNKEATMPLKAEDRRKVVDDLVESCCWEEDDRKVLNALTDEQLTRLHLKLEEDEEMMVAINAAVTTLGIDPNLEINELPEAFKKKAGAMKTKKQKKGFKWSQTDDDGDEDEDEDEPTGNKETDWMDKIPKEAREDLEFARNEKRKRKEEIVEKLLANVEDDKIKKLQKDRLMARNIEDLEADLALLPEEKPAGRTNYSGLGGGSPLGNSGGKKPKPLAEPVHNYDDLSPLSKKGD